MLNPSSRARLLIGLGLVALVAATRSHHFATPYNLPDASWAVFFLAGVYLRSPWLLAGLLAEAALVDFAAVTLGGVSSFCVSPAYVFLLPAYSALWLAGRWYAGHHRFAWSTLLPLVGALLLGTVACELLSSGGFYLFSGRFADTSLSGFGARLVTYLPGSLQSVAFYVAPAALVHAFLGLAGGAARPGAATKHP